MRYIPSKLDISFLNWVYTSVSGKHKKQKDESSLPF